MEKVAHAYPGQGAQFRGMAKFVSRPVRDIAASSFSDLLKVLETDDPKLDETMYTQPAVYLVEVSLMNRIGPPSLILGHSSGEYAALVEAGVWDRHTGFEIIRARSYFSQTLAPPGFMAQVPMSEAQTLTTLFPELFVAVINTPDLAVIAGLRDQWASVQRYLDERAVEYHLLPISAPFHTPHMEKAAKRLRAFLQVNPGKVPAVPVYLNALKRLAQDYDDVVEGLSQGITTQLNWTESQDFARRQGITRMVEIYPKPFLCKFSALPCESAMDYYHLGM
ncbi:ACP S-malonyltransferase [Coprothermobacteraceae bacterium]|nr:ACP S-malonyltransferase [Coprothermobacteraceae bacterium]